MFTVKDKCIWIGCSKLAVLWWEYVASANNGLTYGPETTDLKESHAECWNSRIKVPFSRLAQWLEPVKTLTTEGFSETRTPMFSSIHLFWSE